MSKAIAQTVGGKRVYWLVAILAAFAVLAAAGTAQREAKATVTPAAYVLTGPFANNDCTGAVATATYGQTVYYCVNGGPDATIVNPLEVAVSLGANAEITGVTQVTGPQPVISGTSVGPGNSRVATYNGLTGTSTFVLRLAARVTGAANTNVPAGHGSLTADDPSNGIGTGTLSTTAYVIQASNLAIAKTMTLNAAGTIATIVLTVTNVGGPNVIDGAGVVVTDFLTDPDFTGVLSMTASVGTCTNDGPTRTVNCGPYAHPVDATNTITIIATTTPPPTTGGVCRDIVNNAQVTSTNGATATVGPVTDSSCAALPSLAPGLYHMNPSGTGLLVDGGTAVRDENRNLVGWDHVVCLVDANIDDNLPGGSLGNNLFTYGGIQPPNANGVIRWRIDTISGTANVQGQAKIIGTDPRFNNTQNLSCVRWYSTGPGEQNVTIVDASGQVIADWANGGGDDVASGGWFFVNPVQLAGFAANNPITSYTALVKEWNTLLPTGITLAGVALTAASNLDGKAVDRGAIFNPATSKYVGAGVAFNEHVLGTHQSIGGTVGPLHVNGALGRLTVGGSCGQVTIDGASIHPTLGTAAGGITLDVGESATYVTIGVPVRFTVATGSDSCASLNNSYTTVTIQTGYWNNLGSIQPVVPDETVRVNWRAALASKQILAAWAGQRVIIEHDWRLPPGDTDGGDSPNPTPNGVCAYTGQTQSPFQTRDQIGELPEGFWVKYVKGSGPGNFLPGTSFVADTIDPIVDLLSPDEANVFVSTNNVQHDTDLDAEGACISRVLFESEREGTVDIEAFAESTIVSDGRPDSRGVRFDNQSKVAFVVYYMKFNTVKLSIVGDRSKPFHNSSLDGLSDYAAGNPWNASTDVTTIDWNVSKDLLIRGRVTGWFRSDNPSGRAADNSDPQNVLPADRWVLPTDWAVLAGGPADPADGTDARGTAEEFRPYYDIMIAPNNTSGLALAFPVGGVNQVASVVAWPAGGSSAGFTGPTLGIFAVSSAANLAPGSVVFVGANLRTVISIQTILNGAGNVVGVSIIVGGPLPAVPAVGTPIFVVTAPFEGPYSLIDIPGLAGAGLGGAALSNLDPNNIRDTIFKDGDVDMWDAPMPPALVSIKLRGTGFLKQVLKSDVYYNGTPNSSAQNYPNPFYVSNIPDSPWIPASNAGGGWDWDSWALDGPGGLGQGPYQFWAQVYRDRNSQGVGEALTNTQRAELQAIRNAFNDQSATRDMVVYSDNHGEFMVTANGDFLTDLSACASNVLGGGKHCKPGDKVGTATVTATAEYPDFRGQHFPVASNSVSVNWTWGGYKDVTIEKGEDPQFSYVVFHALDRDGACFVDASTGRVSLHPVWTADPNDKFNGNPSETVDFLVDSGEGIILSSALGGVINKSGNRQFAEGVNTFSTLLNDPAVTGIREFPLSALAASGATDECQAWIKVSNSLLGILNVLVIAHNDEGDVGFDRIVDFQTTATYTLNFRWSLITWNGADNIPVADALKGTGANDAGNDIFDQITAIYGWDAPAQDWLAYFPAGVSVPGANDLVTLKKGAAYWVAIVGPSSVTWTYATNVGA